MIAIIFNNHIGIMVIYFFVSEFEAIYLTLYLDEP